MLIKLTIENFLSIKDKVVLDLSATSIKELESDNLIHTHSSKLLKCLAIYGANSSGKSNILKAILFIKKFVLNSSKDQSQDFIPVTPFLLNTRTEERPSFFEMEFLLDGVTYRYGFEVDSNYVHKEYLHYTKINKEYNYFSRSQQEITVDNKFEEGKGLESKTRSNTLFLSVTSQLNGPISMKITNWLHNIKFIFDQNNNRFFHNHSMKLFEKPEFANLIRRFLNRADLGFTNIESIRMSVPPDAFTDATKELREFLTFEIKKENNILFTEHQKFDENEKFVSHEYFNFLENESQGTQKYFALSGMILDSLINGNVIFIDEFDAKWHPFLCESIIKLFNSKNNNIKGSQLIFVAHNTSFLNKTLFRRDQIIIADKNPRLGNTTIESLAQKNVRSDEAYEKKYLQGDYFGVPKIADFNLFDPY
jgi:AAA15 family ATPase/GTPase